MFVDPRHLYIPPKEKMLSQLTITTYQNHGWLLRRKYTYTDIYIYICLQLQSLNHVLSFKEKNIFYSKKTCGDLRTKQNLPRKSLNLRKKKKKNNAELLCCMSRIRPGWDAKIWIGKIFSTFLIHVWSMPSLRSGGPLEDRGEVP